MEKKNVYVMRDVDNIHECNLWVIKTDCDIDKMEEIVRLAKNLQCDDETKYDGIDLSNCWSVDEYLVALLVGYGYTYDGGVADVIEW